MMAVAVTRVWDPCGKSRAKPKSPTLPTPYLSMRILALSVVYRQQEMQMIEHVRFLMMEITKQVHTQ